jgi:branched-subunit amino acid aminotransferase/4-amino-4-deoxychorismate lyase
MSTATTCPRKRRRCPSSIAASFADGVYEVTSVLGGKLIDFDGHAKRLQRSLSELQMKAPVR